VGSKGFVYNKIHLLLLLEEDLGKPARGISGWAGLSYIFRFYGISKKEILGFQYLINSWKI